MTPDFIAVKDDWTVKDVLDHIRDHGRDSETLNVVYVVDDRGKLIDDVRIREFLLQPLEIKVSDLRDRNFVALKVTDLEQDVVPIFRKYDRTVLPAVDSDGRLVGIVTVDDILDVAEKEATEDIQKIGGLEALDAPYLVINIFSMIKKRAGWLALLFMGELLTSTAMTRFQDELEKLIVLGLFLPLIISSGGNSGSQATSLIIRSLALRDVQLRDWFRVLRRELTAGLALGLVLAVIGLVRIVLWQKFGWADYSHGGQFPYMTVAWAVSFSLVGVVLWGSVMGAMLPFLLRACRFDPAVCSAPLVATLVDVTGLVIYFEIAKLLFRM
jgi:magnesium transporter